MPEPAIPETPPTSGKRRKILLAAASLLLLAGGAGGAGWYWWSGTAARGEDTASSPSRPAPPRIPVFVPLDQFTVNLADEGGERFAQVALTLEVADADTSAAIKTQMPAIRNSILILLSSKQAAELLSVAGKERLAQQIAEQTGMHLGWQRPANDAPSDTPERQRSQQGRNRPNPVEAVHFAHFVVQ